MAQVGGDGSQCEPNLIPLLDLVLQLVMFFIMVSNFAAQENNADVSLPASTSARAPDPGETDLIYLNLNDKGALMVTGQEPLANLAQIKYFLMSEYSTAKRTAESKGQKTVTTVVVIRADKNSDFKPIYEILREAKTAGFSKWQLRTYIKTKPG